MTALAENKDFRRTTPSRRSGAVIALRPLPAAFFQMRLRELARSSSELALLLRSAPLGCRSRLEIFKILIRLRTRLTADRHPARRGRLFALSACASRESRLVRHDPSRSKERQASMHKPIVAPLGALVLALTLTSVR